MNLKVLYRNHVTHIETDSLSTDDEENMIDDNSWKTWLGDNESTTKITGIFDSGSSPGVDHLVDSVAIVHNLPLTTTSVINLYRGGNTAGDIVHTSPSKQLLKDISTESIFHSVELDSNGHLIDDSLPWHVFIYHLPVPVVATELDIDLTYPSAIDPSIRYVFAGRAFSPGYNVSRAYSMGSVDYTRNNYSLSGNKFSSVQNVKRSGEFSWPLVSKKEMARLNQINMYLGTGRSLIVDTYGDDDYRTSLERYWCKMLEPIEITRSIHIDDYYEAVLSVQEH